MKLMLMHTMGGKPASYVPGGQICFAPRSPRFPVRLCADMAEIRTQRKASAKYRRAQKLGLSVHPEGFVYVAVG